jgi:excisionase family DNA binding protein
MNAIQPEFLAVCDAASLLACSQDTIRRRIRDGSLRSYRIAGKAVRVRVVDVLALAEPVDPHGFAHSVAGAR